MQPPELATERLRLRPLRHADAAALLAPWSDADTLRYWHRAPRRSVAECEAVLAEMLAPEGACQWAVCAQGGDEALGHVGFLDCAPGRRAPFGYLLRREYWGRGLGPEAARAALRAGCEQLGIAGAELWIHAGNLRSQRVAEKLGATLRGRFVAFYPERAAGIDTLVYGVTAAELGVTGAAPDPVAVYGITPILETEDVAAAVDFYRRKLGFALDWQVGVPPTAAGVSRGDWTPRAATLRFTRVSEQPARRSGVLAMGVDDVDRLADELREAGVVIEAGPTSQPWGLRELDVVDVLGQRLRFFAPVAVR